MNVNKLFLLLVLIVSIIFSNAQTDADLDSINAAANAAAEADILADIAASEAANKAAYAAEAAKGVFEEQKFTTDASFKVQNGVRSIDVVLNGGNGGDILTATLSTNPGDSLDISADGGCAAISLKGEVLVQASNGDEACESKYASNVIQPTITQGLSTQFSIWCGWWNTCPLGYTELKSDFDPILQIDSSLYLTSGTPSLQVNFQLPNYYNNVVATYDSQCSAEPTLTPKVLQCNTKYQTSINYVDDCTGFTLDEVNDDFRYRGILYISATLDFEVDGYTLTREVSSPLSWEVFINREIEVTADVVIGNKYVCYEDADCTDDVAHCAENEPCGIDSTPEITGCCITDPDNDRVGQCNCEGECGLSGYAGTYCQIDITPPEPIYSEWNSIYFLSQHGGCIEAGGRNLLPARGLSDNSEDPVVVVEVIINTPDGNYYFDNFDDGFPDDSFCFPIGVNYVYYEFKDSSDRYYSVSYIVEIIDRASPALDCSNCQLDAADGELNVCEGNASGWTLTTMTEAAFQAAVADDAHTTTYNPTLLPGQLLDIAADTYLGHTAFNGYLDCECIFTDGGIAPANVVITNSWESWRSDLSDFYKDITSFDSTDGEIAVAGLDDPVTTGRYGNVNAGWLSDPILYTVIDYYGNVGYCHVDVIYDKEFPECAGHYGDVSYIPNDGAGTDNYNYSQPVDFPEIIGFSDPLLDDGSVGSGFFSSVSDPTTLTPPRVNGDQYDLSGQTSNFYIYSYYSLTDKAGNPGGCDWDVYLRVSDCQWNEDFDIPYCDDTQPQLVENTCPTSNGYNCDTDNEDCGCGVFTAPQFTDDKGAVHLVITATVNGDDVADVVGLPNQPLSIGDNLIVYTATDVHGQFATCEFNIHYADNTAPLVYVDGSETAGCPDSILKDSDEQLCVTEGTTYDSYSLTYLGEDECVLDTTVFTTETFTPTAPLDANENHPFTFTIYDDSGNPKYCAWNVYVADCVAPEIACQGPYNERNAQGTTATTIDFLATATDSSGEDAVITYQYNGSPIIPPSSFAVGSHTVTATATDNGDNTDKCDIIINIYEAYPVGTFEAALTGAVITQNGAQGDSTTTGDYSADIDFITVTNTFHSVDAAVDGASGDNADITANLLTATAASCGLTDAICREDWSFDVTFTECNAEKAYNLVGVVTCDAPADYSYTGESECQEADTPYTFSITLAASNYCWQELAAVTFKDSFITVDTAVFNTFLAGTPSYASLPGEQTLFGHQDEIVGIIAVSSESVQPKSVTILGAEKTHYDDAFYTTEVDDSNIAWTGYQFDLLATAAGSGADWAAFKYNEVTVPLEETHYIRYTATVQLDYFFGQRRRRSLLQVDSENVKEQTSTADAAIFAQASTVSTDNVATTNPDNAVVVMKLQNCAASTPELEVGIASAIAAYLRIAQDRVIVSIDTTSDGCFVSVTVSQAVCDSITITELLQQLEQATRDPFNELHGYIYNEQDVPSDMTLDSSVFFVQQQPQTVLSSSASSSSSSTGSSESMDWYVLVAVGAALGAIVGGLYIHKSKKSSTAAQPEERRYSVAELLASNSN